MRKGFTLLEILVVMAILAVLASIVQPAFARARYAAQVTSSAQRLRQLFFAVELYRVDEGLTGYTVDEFPPYGYVYQTKFRLGDEFFRSPCGYKEGIESNQKKLSYQYCPAAWDKVVIDHYNKYLENSLLFRDPHCNTVFQWESVHVSKRKLAILAGGRLVNELATGNHMPLEWWLPRDVKEIHK